MLHLLIFNLVTLSVAQFEIPWAKYEEPCTNSGPPGDFEGDNWFLNSHCLTYNGTVFCQGGKELGTLGQCACNLRENAYFDEEILSCVGKVGAPCTAEYTAFLPEKRCTQNAHCVPNRKDHVIGTCKCLDGYIETHRQCEKDEAVGDQDRSTPRTTTTTEAPDNGGFKLPPLSLILGIQTVGYRETCRPYAALNKTFCESYFGTVSCFNNYCSCLGVNTEFDDQVNMCVGLVNSPCLMRGNVLGYKICTQGADCFADQEFGSFEDGYSLGKCNCLHGYDEIGGKCVRNTTVANPSTPRQIMLTTTTPKLPINELEENSCEFTRCNVLLIAIVYFTLLLF